jgi:predicted outer membrane protein
MSVSIMTKGAVLAAGLSCLCVAYALAQQVQVPGQPTQPTPPGQPGQPVQSDRMYQNTPRTTTGTTQSSQTARGESSELDQFFAACLLTKNQGEVELGRFAAERAQNPQVKQFAQTMVSDHSQLLPKLQQLAGNLAEQPGNERSRTGLSAGTDRDRESTTPGQPGVGQSATSRQQTTTGTSGQTSTTTGYGQTSGQTPGGADRAIQQLVAIDKQIADKAQDSFREKLQQKQGAEFDECYIGSQIMGHLHMLAALDVLKSQSQGQLRQIAQEAEPKVRQHLQQAEQIAEQLNKGAQTRQAEAGRPGGIREVPR